MLSMKNSGLPEIGNTPSSAKRLKNFLEMSQKRQVSMDDHTDLLKPEPIKKRFTLHSNSIRSPIDLNTIKYQRKNSMTAGAISTL